MGCLRGRGFWMSGRDRGRDRELDGGGGQGEIWGRGGGGCRGGWREIERWKLGDIGRDR